MGSAFDFTTAFTRNVGWVTKAELAVLRGKKVAIAGLGGVGGSHLLTLTRLGVSAFHISDFDTFDLVNFNRQAGASMAHLGRPKVDVLSEMALDINPELGITTFPEGINAGNLEAFFDGVDVYVDGLDFFAVDARRLVFAKCAEYGIPAVTAAPLGMGVSLLNFLPGKTTFEQYFKLDGYPEREQLLRFLVGLSPVQLQFGALVDESTLNLAEYRGPSTAMGCEFCAGAAATQVLKILLHRGPVLHAPRALHFDAYSNRLKVTWRPGGSDNLLTKMTLAAARKRLHTRLKRIEEQNMSDDSTAAAGTPINRVLDLARWAPSGDNTQPWRFEIIDGTHCVMHGSDTRDWCVYDLEGHASQLAVGACLETAAIAATKEGMLAEISRRPSSPDEAPEFEISLKKQPESGVDPLLEFIEVRVTQRRPFTRQSLHSADRVRMEQSLPAGYGVVWLAGAANLKKMSSLLFKNAHIRLTIPEAYRVHKEIIDWGKQFSDDKIPAAAVGLDPVALQLMQWAMKSWDRVNFMNRYMAGTWLPRLQLDYLPGLKCAAHFLIVADRKLESADDFIAGGRAMQRFWLAATAVGLQFQPEMTPLIFSQYAGKELEFCEDQRAIQEAHSLRQDLGNLVGQEAIDRGVFLGRVGYGKAPRSRSLRLSLEHLRFVN
jgi:molybdopterin/thiamine biosynthesis adenylyltransferase